MCSSTVSLEVIKSVITRCLKRPEHIQNPVCVLVTVLHAEEDVVLRTDPQVLSDGAELGANVFAEDVRCTRGGREQSRQD